MKKQKRLPFGHSMQKCPKCFETREFLLAGKLIGGGELWICSKPSCDGEIEIKKGEEGLRPNAQYHSG